MQQHELIEEFAETTMIWRKLFRIYLFRLPVSLSSIMSTSWFRFHCGGSVLLLYFYVLPSFRFVFFLSCSSLYQRIVDYAANFVSQNHIKYMVNAPRMKQIFEETKFQTPISI